MKAGTKAVASKSGVQMAILPLNGGGAVRAAQASDGAREAAKIAAAKIVFFIAARPHTYPHIAECSALRIK